MDSTERMQADRAERQRQQILAQHRRERAEKSAECVQRYAEQLAKEQQA